MTRPEGDRSADQEVPGQPVAQGPADRQVARSASRRRGAGQPAGPEARLAGRRAAPGLAGQVRRLRADVGHGRGSGRHRLNNTARDIT